MLSSAEVKQSFKTISLPELNQMKSEDFDLLPYGVIGLSSEGLVEVYNSTESKLAGLSTAKVMGTPFFLSVAQCMNNYLVAQRFEDEPSLDVLLPYILTFRMRPTPVTLRLVKSSEYGRSFLLIQR